MKKESKNFKTRISIFIVLMIFTLLYSNRMFAQCTEVINGNCATEIQELHIIYGDLSCYAESLTDLKNTGVGPAESVTIEAKSFVVDITDVKIDLIDIYDDKNPCEAMPGGHFTSASDFNIAGLGITIHENTSEVTIEATSIFSLIVGYHLNFTVNVYSGLEIVASRNYFTKIPSTTLLVGDTHITTVDGVRYDFQAVGEFVSLISDNLEIQTRQTEVATNGPGHDSYDNLRTCVSVNTAVAARVGEHRITYQPNINGIPDSSGMQLRVDGELTVLGDNGFDLGSGGRVMNSPAGGGAIEIDFPDGTSLTVTPGWWSSYNQWYLNVTVNNTTARKGISGAIAYNDPKHRSKSWLPALPDGSSLGLMPESLHDRFVMLYQTFADAWRVTDSTSLFDYVPGTSTATFTDKNWPTEDAELCSVEGQNPEPPIPLEEAEDLTSDIVDPNLKPNAIYDVMLTGEPTFAETYLLTQKILASTTVIRVDASKDETKYEEPVSFTAIVSRKFAAGEDILTGSAEFNIDGTIIEQVNLDAKGRAILTTTSLEVGQHQIAAKFIPDAGSAVFPSSSPSITHTVKRISAFSLSVHSGLTFPAGNFSNSYSSDWLGEIDVEYHFSGAYSTELVAGYYNFDSDYKVIGAALYAKVHKDLGAFDGYVGAGPGFYKPDNVSGSFAISGKMGIQRPVTNMLWIDLNGAYFRLFGPGNNIDFFTTSLGIRLYF